MNKKEKYYDLTNSLITGTIFILISITLLIGREIFYKNLVNFIVIVLLIMVIHRLMQYVYKKQTKQEINSNFSICILNLFICTILLTIPKISYSILPLIFAIYLFLIGTIQFVMYGILLKNKVTNKIKKILLGIIYYIIALPILISPYNKINTFLNCISIYSMLLGITLIYDFIINVIPIKTKNKLKRKIRITLPKILEMIIPYSVMLEINKNLQTDNENIYKKRKNEETVDLEILIHTSNRGVNKVGHIDIIFENIVYSYGNYNENSRKFYDFFGSGILFKTNNINEYINFCIDNSKKTLFIFGVTLTEKQKQAVKNKIEEITNNTTSWNYKESIKKNEKDSYASKLYKKTKAKFYKFKKGKYKTYFILGTNCCHLADDIIGKSGIDILSINGIITPGTYYDYLNRQFHYKNSIVISKEIYNEKSRPNRK